MRVPNRWKGKKQYRHSISGTSRGYSRILLMYSAASICLNRKVARVLTDCAVSYRHRQDPSLTFRASARVSGSCTDRRSRSEWLTGRDPHSLSSPHVTSYLHNYRDDGTLADFDLLNVTNVNDFQTGPSGNPIGAGAGLQAWRVPFSLPELL